MPSTSRPGMGRSPTDLRQFLAMETKTKAGKSQHLQIYYGFLLWSGYQKIASKNSRNDYSQPNSLKHYILLAPKIDVFFEIAILISTFFAALRVTLVQPGRFWKIPNRLENALQSQLLRHLLLVIFTLLRYNPSEKIR